MTIVALVADLFFASRITATAAQLAVSVQIARSPDAVLAAAAGGASVILDLTVDAPAMPELIHALKAAAPTRRIVAFLPHVEIELARLARAAGADDVLPRSAFSRRLPELLTELAGPTSPSRSAIPAAPDSRDP